MGCRRTNIRWLGDVFKYVTVKYNCGGKIVGGFVKGWKGKNERGDDCEIVADCLTDRIYPLLVVCTKPTTGIVGYYQANKEGKNDNSFCASGYDLVSNRHPAMERPVDAKSTTYWTFAELYEGEE